MTVLILDLDWIFDKSEVPNVNCMKLSSFHKQHGDQVYFVGDLSDLTLSYDKLYVFGESDSTPALSSKVLNDAKTVLFGKRFELCGAKKLGAVIMGCRPDYLLYDIANEKSNSYLKANFITFYTDRGEKVHTRQAWKNTKKGVKRTIVTDQALWQQNPEEVEQCLEDLKNEKNIVFLAPISIKFLIDNSSVRTKFFNLHFSKGTKFKWRNDVGSDVAAAIAISNLIIQLRQHTKSNIGSIPIKPYGTEGCWEKDLQRLLSVFAVFKKHKIKCFLPAPNNMEHPIYVWLRHWCDKGFENSFIEEMVFFTAASKGRRWFQIVNDPRSWTEKRVRFIITLLNEPKWREFLPQMSIQWGGDSIDYTCINFDVIEKNAYLII